jgi:hypothetical protein
MNGGGVYLYCLTPASHVDRAWAGGDLPTLLGPVCGEILGGLGAVVSPVADLAEWNDDTRINSLDWVTPRALHHARIVEHMWQQAPVYPAGFGTLFTSRDSLQQLIDRHRSTLEDFFDSTCGMAEWGIKVFFDPLQAEKQWMEERLQQETARLAVLPAGQRYLAEQGLRRECRRDLVARLETVCQELAEELTRQAGGFRVRPLPASEDSARQPLGHWAILWPRKQDPVLREFLEIKATAHAAAGIELQWSGPWPPYSFRPALEVKAGSPS